MRFRLISSAIVIILIAVAFFLHGNVATGGSSPSSTPAPATGGINLGS